MSKHVWRMHSRYDMMYGIQASEPDLTDKANCTLVPDEACFPVREAMRLCWAFNDNEEYSNQAKIKYLHKTATAYRNAVARMNAKAKKGSK